MQTLYTTDRLILKVQNASAAKEVLDFYVRNREHLRPFEPKKPDDFYTERYQAANLQAEYNAFMKFNYLRFWAYEIEGSDAPIGTICYNYFRGGYYGNCEVGYKLDAAATGKGFAKEMLGFTAQLVYEEYKMHRIEALTLPENGASIRLLEGLGFVREGLLHNVAQIDGAWRDHYLYTLLFETSNSQ